MKKITAPLSEEVVKNLRMGDQVLLSGGIYTGRDAAHKRLIELLAEGKPLPFDLSGQAIYYTGPCPAPPGRAVGSVGPTTSQRMDPYAPRLIQEGLRVMIGKGNRSDSVIKAIRTFSGVYFAATGGVGALMALCVERAEIVAFNDLGPEAIYRLAIRDMPLTVAIDCAGGNIYER